MANSKLRFKKQDGSSYPEWEEKILDKLLDLIIDNRGKTPPLSSSGYPLIEISAVGEYFLKYNEIQKYVNQEIYDKWFRKHLQQGDILFSTVGNTALCSYYDEKKKCCIAQNIIGLRFNKKIDSRYIFYMFTEQKNQRYIKSIQMNAVQPSIKVTQFIKLKFLIPCFEEQQKIADVLSAADENARSIEEKIQSLKILKQGLLQKIFG